MDIQAAGKVQSIRVGGDFGRNSEWAHSGIVELPRWSSGSDVSGVQPNEISWSKVGSVQSAAVVLFLLNKLGSSHLSCTVSMDLSKLSSTGAGFLFVYCPWGFGFQVREHPRILAVCCKKRRNTSGLGGLVVGSEFCSCQPVGPIILDIVNVASKILLHDSVRSLRLSIRLRVECRRELPFDTKLFAQMHPKFRGELGSSV